MLSRPYYRGLAIQVTEIVKDWLKSHGYDGLYTDECGCRIADLAPCGGEGMSECCAGVYKPCDPAMGYDYWIGLKEPTPEDSGAGEHISQQTQGGSADASTQITP